MVGRTARTQSRYKFECKSGNLIFSCKTTFFPTEEIMKGRLRLVIAKSKELGFIFINALNVAHEKDVT